MDPGLLGTMWSPPAVTDNPNDGWRFNTSTGEWVKEEGPAPRPGEGVGRPQFQPPEGLTGNYITDIPIIRKRLSEVEDELFNYMQNSTGTLDLSPSGTMVMDYSKPNEETGEMGVIDPVGTKLLGEYNFYNNKLQTFAAEEETAYNRAQDASKTGAAREFVGAQRTFNDIEANKATEGDRAYADYIGRLGNVQQLETAPFDRDTKISDAFRQTQSDEVSRNQAIKAGDLMPFAAQQGFQYPGKGFDFSPYMQDVAATLPDQAPSYVPYDANKANANMIASGLYTDGSPGTTGMATLGAGGQPVGWPNQIGQPRASGQVAGGTNQGGSYVPSAGVEQWRPLVEKYFRPEDVEKALYVMNIESGGQPGALGDGVASGGLFQLNDQGLGAGMTNEQKFDPETNIRVAAQAVYGGSGWRPWGEGTEIYDYPYDPSTGLGYFGALGHHPYQAGSAPINAASSPANAANTGAGFSAMGMDPSQPSDSGMAIPWGTLEERSPILQMLMQQDSSNWGGWQ